MMQETIPTIAVVGGGSGGHITPVLSVARELKRLHPQTRIIYIGQKGDRLSVEVQKSGDVDDVYLIRAGKFRRYHGEHWLRRLLDIKTVMLNVRDFFRFIHGTFESFIILRKERPKVLFIKGGFVGVPVGIAARLHRMPFITHDSDAVAGLANRIIGRWAALHATGMPAEYYPYPIDRIVHTGVPIREAFYDNGDDAIAKARRSLALKKGDQAILVVGGGLGSQAVNNLVQASAPQLLEQYPQLHIYHIAGLQHQQAVQHAYNKLLHPREARRVHVVGFTKDIVSYAAAADIIIGRGGATHLAEMAALKKASVIVPHPNLTGGHQLKNTAHLAAAGAIVVVNQDAQPEAMQTVISDLLSSEVKRRHLAKKLHSYAKPGVSQEIANLLFQISNKKEERG